MNAKQARHTPGPWGYQLGSIVDSEGYLIADVRSRFDDGMEGVDYHHVNAALIAAAPDLLAALELIYANAAESPEWIRERISPAIAKARGQS